ncbi:MAG: hypothetical protein HYU66_14960 [Armatimonadetes bacterium]|nr:hypothetical protein [Armatimonadota bacterium]
MADLRITSPRDGDVLNFHDGVQTDDRLTITVAGVAPPQSQVVVNGVTINVDGGRFAVDLPLTQFYTDILAVGGDHDGHRIRVYWDRHACRRYRFSTDDNIQFLRDIAEHADTYRSLFDNPYLAFWRRMHDQYGVRVQHNIYWCDPGGFDLPQFPDRFRGEWKDNADWLRLTFHAEQDKPDKPYLGAPYEVLAHDFDRVTNEILRFAGPASLSPYTTVHWGEATFDGCRALRERGIVGLAGYFFVDRYAPPGCGEPLVGYYLSAEECAHLAARDAWKCHRGDLWFIKHDIVCNSHPVTGIRPQLDSVFANPHRRELMEVMIHEQYFCDFLPNYMPDAEQRVVEAVEWLGEHDYKPVYYEEGFLGAPDPGA